MIKLIILGQAPSKKNTHRSMYSKSKRRFIIAPSAAYLEWENLAILQLMHQMNHQGIETITKPVHVKFLIYRAGKARVDLSNLIQSCEDALERAGIIENDFQIESLDGSRRIIGVKPGDAKAEIYVEVVK